MVSGAMVSVVPPIAPYFLILRCCSWMGSVLHAIKKEEIIFNKKICLRSLSAPVL